MTEMKDETQLNTYHPQSVLSIDPQLPTPVEREAARLGYNLGHTLGFGGGWDQGLNEGAGSAGWVEKAKYYSIPAAIGGYVVGQIVARLLV